MKKILLHLFSPIFLVLSANIVHAQTWNSVQNGNWNDPATWGSSNYPPAELGSGKHVNILHSVSINNSFASTLKVNSGASINIIGGTFLVGTGISMENRGRFTGINGSLLQCLYVGCGSSGSQASGIWTTLDGGYTRMENMTIQIAQDWTTTNGGKRFHKNCCVKTGQNFSINHEDNRDTLINTRFEIGLHGSGNFQQNKGVVIYDNIDIVVAGSGGGDVQFSDGSFSGRIRAISMASNGNIQASSSVSGNISLDYYCISNPSNYQDPANKILNEIRDCNMVNNILAQPCSPAGQVGGGEEEESPRELNDQGFGSIEQQRITRIYPNPFTQELELEFTIQAAGKVTLTLHDLTGRKIMSRSEQLSAGSNRLVLSDCDRLYPGVYIATIETGNSVIARAKVLKK